MLCLLFCFVRGFEEQLRLVWIKTHAKFILINSVVGQTRLFKRETDGDTIDSHQNDAGGGGGGESKNRALGCDDVTR